MNLDLQQDGLDLWQGRADNSPGPRTKVIAISKEDISEKIKIKVARRFNRVKDKIEKSLQSVLIMSRVEDMRVQR